MELFVSCIPGLEEVVSQEIAALGYTSTKGRAGVFVPYEGMNQIYRLNLFLRSASRVLLPLATFSCRDKHDLYKGALKIDWKSWFSDKMPTFAIDPFVMHKAFQNSLFAAQVVKDAICDKLKEAFGKRPNVDTSRPDIGFHLYLVDQTATISFDTSNPPLHCRGYRVEGGVAPLRENLAAALLLLSGYTAADTLCDPCCGSGTFLIEAAMIAANRASGINRASFGFFMHPEYNQDDFEAIKAEAKKAEVPIEKGKFFGIEESVKTYSILKRAIHNAKLDRWIEVKNANFKDIEPNNPTFVIANPPYGVRLNEIKELEELYRELGNFMKRKTVKPAKGAIFTGSLELAKCVGLKTSKRHVLSNGGIECRLLVYDLYEAEGKSENFARDV